MKKLLPALLLLFAFNKSYSQLNYLAANAQNVTGTYTDLGTNGSVITTPGFDDDNSDVQTIGFNFNFNGTVFTQFILNTNGVIKLGNVAPADARLTDALASAETNLLYPLNLDLVEGTGTEYRVYRSGRAPNRICTIQFKNVQDYFAPPATAPQFAAMNFQVRLYETSNNIDFVYGTFTPGEAADASVVAAVGIKGADATSSVNVTKGSSTAWSAATFISGNYTTNAHNIRNAVLPGSGQAYAFRSSSALPVKLSGFSGNIQNNTAYLSWLASADNGNDHFEIERSQATAIKWSKAGSVIAAENFSAANKYVFTDAGLGNGKWLYRLKIVDKDGRFTYSPVLSLQVKSGAVFALSQNYPNPAATVTMIGYELAKTATVTIELYGLDGKKLMSTQKGKQAKGTYNFPLDIESLSLSNGKYIYRLLIQDAATGEFSSDKKFMEVIR